MPVWKYRPVHGQSAHLVNATIPLLHQKIIVQHFWDRLAILLRQIVFRHCRSLDGLFQLSRKNGFFSMQSLNLEFFLNVKIFSYLVKMKIQTLYRILEWPWESERRHHLEMCKDVKSGYNYSCHRDGNDDLSNHIVSFSFVAFVIDECKVSEVNRLWDPNQNTDHHHCHA